MSVLILHNLTIITQIITILLAFSIIMFSIVFSKECLCTKNGAFLAVIYSYGYITLTAYWILTNKGQAAGAYTDFSWSILEALGLVTMLLFYKRTGACAKSRRFATEYNQLVITKNNEIKDCITDNKHKITIKRLISYIVDFNKAVIGK